MADKVNILVVNGPNLNMLGMREPETYGTLTLDAIKTKCEARCNDNGFDMAWMQSNSEGVLIDTIQQACGKFDWIIINGAGLTHTSVALRDALALFPGGVIEVHLSNIHARESFRHISLITPIAKGAVFGFGAASYSAAIAAIADLQEES
jgi:3-dehydroquinate dehydratase-2